MKQVAAEPSTLPGWKLMVGMPTTNVECWDAHDGLISLGQHALRLLQSENLLLQDVTFFGDHIN